MFFDRKPPVPVPSEDLANLKITDARLQDTLSVAGAAPDFSALEFTIDRAQLDQRQNPADFFDFENKFWLYRFSREVMAFTPEAPGGKGVYCWQFAEQGGRRFLSIRKLEGESFSATIWSQLEPTDITVYRGV